MYLVNITLISLPIEVFWSVKLFNVACVVLFLEDAYKTQIRIDDEPANLDILDTAGQVGARDGVIKTDKCKTKHESSLW